MAPLTVVALAAFGVRLAKTDEVGRWEAIGYGMIALSLIALGYVVLSGRSGLASGGARQWLGLAALTVSGASITISLLYSKRLQDHDVSSAVVTSVRYLALIAVAAMALAYKGRLAGINSFGEAATLSLLATILIVLPLYAFQVGIGLTAPLTANVLRSLGPVFVFALQPFDERLIYSTPTLVCILAYSAAAIASNVAHQWHVTQSRRSELPGEDQGRQTAG